MSSQVYTSSPPPAPSPLARATSSNAHKGTISSAFAVPSNNPDFGALQAIADEVAQRIPKSGTFAIEYPASGITVDDDGQPVLHHREYTASVLQGYEELKTHLEEYNCRFPRTRVAVMGYSQVGSDLISIISSHFFSKEDGSLEGIKGTKMVADGAVFPVAHTLWVISLLRTNPPPSNPR